MYHKTGQKKFCKVGRELDGILEISDTRWKAKSPQPCGFAGFRIERKSANEDEATIEKVKIFIMGILTQQGLEQPRKPPIDRPA